MQEKYFSMSEPPPAQPPDEPPPGVVSHQGTETGEDVSATPPPQILSPPLTAPPEVITTIPAEVWTNVEPVPVTNGTFPSLISLELLQGLYTSGTGRVLNQC